MDESSREGWFYAVHIRAIPTDGGGDSAGPATKEGKVFTSEIDALKFLKENKKAGRYKRFETRKEAEEFVARSFVPPTPHFFGAAGDFAFPTPEKAVVEESCSFPGLSWPQLTKMKRAIEARDEKAVETMIEDNPRYLINVTGETPTVIHAGCRYNALHVATMQGQAKIAAMILGRISDPEYISRLFPDSQGEEIDYKRLRFIVEGFLNTPDKSTNMVPLHYAASFGYLEIVKLLTAYPECALAPLNKKGKTPSEIACTQIANGNVVATSAKEIERIRDEIKLSCSESSVYVSLYRPRGYSGAPVLRSPRSERPENVLVSPTRRDSGLSQSPNQPTASSPAPTVGLFLAAVAGPMNKDKANEFYSRWKTSGIHTPSSGKSMGPASFRRSDIHKGMERIGRSIAKEMNCSWTEYWPFLQTFADLSTPEGMTLLEEYLKGREEGLFPPTCMLNGTGVLRSLAEMDETSMTSPFASPLRTKQSWSLRKSAARAEKSTDQENPKDDSSQSRRPVPHRLDFGFVDDDEKKSSSPGSAFETQTSEEDYQDALLDQSGENKKSEHPKNVRPPKLCLPVAPESPQTIIGGKKNSLKIAIPSCDGGSDQDVSSENRDSTDERESSDFVTPPSTPPAIYIAGDKPTKMDLDVFLAIEGQLMEMNENSTGPFAKFHHISKWASVMKIYSPGERAEWPGLDSPRSRTMSSSTSTPGPAARINFSAYLPEKFSSRTHPASPLSSVTR